jgi:hypothetical protein
MNLEALGAMDDCEHATGKPLHMHEVTIPHPRTAKEIIVAYFNELPWSEQMYDERFDQSIAEEAEDLLQAIRDGGYDILERVSVYKK